MKDNRKATLIILHLMLMIYSVSGITSKKASGTNFLSTKFIVFYSVTILLLGLYAIVWQQIIKEIPLSTAFANKAMTVVWGLIYGTLFFGEKLSVGKIVGATMVILGVVIIATPDEKRSEITEGSKNEI